MTTNKILANVENGKTFKIANIEFIKFSEENGNVIAVAKSSLYDMQFGDNNNFAESRILAKLKEEVLPKLEEAVGAENIVEFETDLLSLDGGDKWGKIKSKISLPTLDFYRQNVKTFDKHKLNDWWWLATPDTTDKHYNDNWVLCVSPHGVIDGGCNSYNYGSGVRPFLIFVSSIVVSCEE